MTASRDERTLRAWGPTCREWVIRALCREVGMRVLLKVVLWTVGIAAVAVVLVVLLWAGTWVYLIAHPPARDPGEERQRSMRLTHWQAYRTAADWLAGDGGLADASGNRFVKNAGWHQFTFRDFSFWPPGDRIAQYYADVEGEYAPGGDATRVRSYSGTARFWFERQADGRWWLTVVTLQGISLESKPALQVVKQADDGEMATWTPYSMRAAALTRESVDAALVEWLTREVVFGDNLMKEAGGTARVGSGPLRPSGISVTFHNVPYHSVGFTTRLRYSGPGSIDLVPCDDGFHWAVGGIYWFGLVRVQPPIWHGGCGKRGIRLGVPPSGPR
jgi:hypothetical protein